MHPRNIYKTPPDFTQLAIDYPEFRQISKLGITGKVKVDFTDAKTVQILTRCLLQKDFDLNVHLPDDKLIPTLTLRLNYILWLEDILRDCLRRTDNETIVGIDIGCGASCVYPLLAAKMNGWQMYALESNVDSCSQARQNVANNSSVSDRITIVQQSSTDVIFDTLLATATDFEKATFCMCNPPFYSDKGVQQHKNRTGRRRMATAAPTGSPDELMCGAGGEVEFVQKIIVESGRLRERIGVYTTMLGHKSSVQPVVQSIQATTGCTNVGTTEFVQGKTNRWAVAWSFDDSVGRLDRMEGYSKMSCKKQTPFVFHAPAKIGLEAMEEKLKSILNDVELTFSEVLRSNGTMRATLMATRNTWSNQRRKRRQQQHQKVAEIENKINLELQDAKRRKIDDGDGPILVVSVVICGDLVQLNYVSGSAGRDGVYQLLQFITNHWK